MTKRIDVSKPIVDIRSELADLKKPTGVAGEAMLRAETARDQFNLINAGRRNAIINGDFQVSQRGDYTGSSTTIADSGYSLDRWKANISHTIRHYTNEKIDGICTNYVNVGRSSGNEGFSQPIENKNYYYLQGDFVTVSAYVRTNNPNYGFRVYDGGQIYGPRFNKTSGEWQRYEWTFYWNNNSASYFILLFDLYESGSYLSSVSGDYMDIAMVQVEKGRVATPFEHRSYGEELALCQRYYYKWTSDAGYNFIAMGYSYQATGSNHIYHFPVTMRAKPTFFASSGTWRICSASCVNNVSVSGGSYNTDSCTITVSTSGLTAGVAYMLGDFNDSSSYISWDAEL